MNVARKILFYIHALSGGGAERVWSVLASAFAERGSEVIFAVDYESSDNVSFLSPAIRLVVLGGSHRQTVQRLARLLREEKPDIAISALGASNLKLVLAATLAGRRNRTIVSYHGYSESEPQTLSRIAYLLTPAITRLAGRTLCVSDGLLGYMRTRWGASRGKSARVYNPVIANNDTDGSAATLATRPASILAAGRMVSYKNFVALIRAFALMPTSDARLVIIGEGPDRAMIEAEVARLGLAGRVELPGYVPEPWLRFAEARCFVLPSRSESFGLVLVEALAHGLPVVATDCHGPREILADGAFGTIVGQGDLPALARAMSEALLSPGDPEARIRRARDFSIAAAVDGYETAIRSVLGEAEGGQVLTQTARPRKPHLAVD